MVLSRLEQIRKKATRKPRDPVNTNDILRGAFMSYDDVRRVLVANGWYEKSQKGSHVESMQKFL